MKKCRVFALAMFVSPVLGCSVFMDPGPERYSAPLRPDPARSPAMSAPNASGTAFFSRRDDVMDFVVTVSSLSSHATAAHIHGPAASGEVAETLFSFLIAPKTTSARLAGGVFNSTSSPGVSFDSLLVLMRNGNAYVDVHTELNPAGEIFGQIERGDLVTTEP